MRQDRAVINIDDLNKYLLFNVYSSSLQSDIISNLREFTHISILNVVTFFYQWKTNFDDVYKQIIVTHRDQKISLVSVIKNKNSIFYVQRQINDILNIFQHFVKVYIDDVVIKSNSLKKHLTHLKTVFKLFVKLNITIKLFKMLISYSNVALLKQRVNF